MNKLPKTIDEIDSKILKVVSCITVVLFILVLVAQISMLIN